MEIKVFEPEANEIIDGQHFFAEIGSVEGRTVVTLKPIKCSDCKKDINESLITICSDCLEYPRELR